MRHRPEQDVIGSRPPQDLGPLFTQPSHGANAASNDVAVEPLRGGRVPSPSQTAPVDSGPMRVPGSESPGSSGAANTVPHPRGAGTAPVRRAHAPHAPGFPFDSGADAARKAFVQRAIATLAPELCELARRRGKYGVDCTDTRRLAIAHGFCTGQEKDQRSLSWFSAVPGRAGLISGGLRDDWTGTGNRPTKYLHPEFAPPREGAA